MSVPLDRLYHYLDDCVNHDLLIYGWMPHGSTKLEDLKMLHDKITPEEWAVLKSTLTHEEFALAVVRHNHAVMICHDQEPLDFDRYSLDELKTVIKKNTQEYGKKFSRPELANDSAQAEITLEYCASLGLRGMTNPGNGYDQTILLHSELHSSHVIEFEQQGYVPVYYWSHGMIAQDWFRYAKHDPVLKFNPANITSDFLVYNRAWSGTREYRLCFTEQIVENGLSQHCKMSFNPQDNIPYHQYQFVNPEFQITNYDLHNFFPANTHTANASADYYGPDYATSGIEVVLETLFDDTRWHLTEKSLRPIACGQPFLLMAAPGSLQYLRQYGFETFEGLLDESYDTVQNPRQRLQAVIKEMSRISALPSQKKIQLLQDLDQIAEKNKHHFFNHLFDLVTQEYANNMDHAMTVMNQHKTGKHYRYFKNIFTQ
jgi:hypothetical protein